MTRTMILAGWAETYVFRSKPFLRRGSYSTAEDSASQLNRGVWRACGGDFHRPA